MKSFEVYSLAESDQWRAALTVLPADRQDVYLTPEYYGVCERAGAGKAQCIAFRENGEAAVYPFLVNSINKLGFDLGKEFHDIQGAYGYNGVGASSADAAFKKSFHEAFLDFIEDRAIVAEFTRFNPVMKNDSFSDYLEPQFSQDNVILDLAQEDIAHNAYEHATRKNVNKAIRNGLSCVKYPSAGMTAVLLDEFLRIYYATMKRNAADSYYFFSPSYFKDIVANLPRNSNFYFTQYMNSIVSTELVMLGTQVAYSFLGGTTAEIFEYRPNDLLKDFIINDLASQGLKYYCLGGGSDGVIKFKKSFAKGGVTPFFIGKKIHNPEIYREVISRWEEKFPEKAERFKGQILKYRK